MRACEELLKSSSAPRQSDSRNGNSSLEGKYYNRSSQMPFYTDVATRSPILGYYCFLYVAAVSPSLKGPARAPLL